MFIITVEILLETDKEKNILSTLLIVVGIDGLPITSNPPSQLWPILWYFYNILDKKLNVFLIGAYCRSSKHSDPNTYLNQFIKELNDLYSTGIIFKS